MIFMKNLENFLIDNDHLGFITVERKATGAKTKSTTARKKSSKITDSELTIMYDSLKEYFKVESFQNRDLAGAGLLEKWSLTNRQTPSRLKKLVAAGKLEDLGGSPKSYKVVS